ncbi:hypothetical protein ACF061_38755 [Streptomyces sp. NPDC015220]|uniref:hypothetical protein n=1 Tax=Streptomyces sp. NPDC015220 TaxID=3364947 RepID=UPI0036FDE744
MNATALQLTDEQLRDLQDAFARLDAPDRSRLGGDVGLAVALQTTPRIQLHRHREERLNRREVPVHAPGSPESRIAKMNALSAEYTLNDREAPDLDAVAHAITDEADGTVRRQRAIALIHVLGRGWAKRYAEHESVTAAYAYRSWNSVDTVPGFWRWRLKEIPWLDSESGNPGFF